MRLVLEISFDGTKYSGWQIQKNEVSVQSTLEEKLALLLNRPIQLVGCGRTDAGVHARQFFLHFDVDPFELERLKLHSMNAVLPLTISVKNMYGAADEFHSRYQANLRKYIYTIHSSKDPFLVTTSFYYPSFDTISISKLQEAAKWIKEMQEFSSFVKSNSGLKNFECSIHQSEWMQRNTTEWEYHISANRFVRGMVRLIVGMCLNYANGSIQKDEIWEAIQNKKQIDKSWSVPALGLSLVQVHYPEGLLINYNSG
ncbi:MAG: tRNA pseudouridine(38-40) synthase TruA [Bacteroidota bacterium]|nr:tRNA pseudouridine(38-40) synthase TruA [Bacteroidota bacterium]